MNWTKAELTSPRVMSMIDEVADFCERVLATSPAPPAEIDNVMDICTRYHQAQSDLAHKNAKGKPSK